MRFLLSILTFLYIIRIARCQPTLLSWNFYSQPTGAFGANGFGPTSLATGVTTTGLMRGTTASASGAPARTWGSDSFSIAASTSALAISASNYFYFTIIPSAGYQISYDSFASHTLRRSGTGPNLIMWQYQIGTLSLGGTFTNINTQVSLGASSTFTAPAIPLNGIADLQNVATAVTFRAVIWGATNTGGTFFFNSPTSAATQDLALTGTAAALIGTSPTPTTSITNSQTASFCATTTVSSTASMCPSATACGTGTSCPTHSASTTSSTSSTTTSSTSPTSTTSASTCPTSSATFTRSPTTTPSVSACSTVSPTYTPSVSSTTSAAVLCTAPPGYFCPPGTNATELCPVGAFCAGGGTGNVSCYPVAACSVTGLSAQPPCYWSVSTVAGNGAAGYADGTGAAAKFNQPSLPSFDPLTGAVFVAEYAGQRVRRISPTQVVTTVVGTGTGGNSGDAAGTATQIFGPASVKTSPIGMIYISEWDNNVLRSFNQTSGQTRRIASGLNRPGDFGYVNNSYGYILYSSGCRIVSVNLISGFVLPFVGSGTCGFSDGVGILAAFKVPNAIVSRPIDSSIFVADWQNNRIRFVDAMSRTVTTLAGDGTAASVDGFGVTARLNAPRAISLDPTLFLFLYFTEATGGRVRQLSLKTGSVTTLSGSGLASSINGYGLSASFNGLNGVTCSPAGVLFVAEQSGNYIRQLSCVPCPASYYCAPGSPVLCPAGSFCPLSSIYPTLCPNATFSNAGASNCTLCPASTFTASTNSTSCQQCISGHFCPTGTSTPLNCGRGNYCSPGSSSPTPCPIQIPPSGGWGAQLVQGLAFLTDTAACLNHCFFNVSTFGFSSALSAC